MSIGYSDIWGGAGVDQGWVGTVIPKVLLRWMPSLLLPLVVAAVSATAADDDGDGDDDDDDESDDDDELMMMMMMMMMIMVVVVLLLVMVMMMMMLFLDLHTCSTRSPVAGNTSLVDHKPCPPRCPSKDINTSHLRSSRGTLSMLSALDLPRSVASTCEPRPAVHRRGR